MANELATTNASVSRANTISALKVGGAVKSAITSAVKGRNSIHVALCMSVQYAWENKGAGLDKYMKQLFQGLFDNDVKANHEQMKAWVENNFPIKVLFDKEKLSYNIKLAKKWDALKDDDWKFSEAKELPFFKLDTKSAADAKPLSYDQIIKMLERVVNIEEKREIKLGDKHRVHELTKSVQGLLEQYNNAA